MNFFSVRARIAFAQVMLLVSAVLGAVSLGIFPSRDATVIEHRSEQVQLLAVSCSAFVSRGDIPSLGPFLERVVDESPHFRTAGVRDAEGKLVLATPDHHETWDAGNPENTVTDQLTMKLRAGEEQHGTIELTFAHMGAGGLLGYFMRPEIRLAIFLGSLCFLFNYFYLAAKLQNLDPSQAVPGRVRSALDTLTEGLLVLDKKQRIVLANKAFSENVGIQAGKLVGKKAAEFKWMIHDETESVIVYPWTEALTKEEAVTGIMMGLRGAGGEVRIFMVSAAPVLNPEGGVQGVLVGFEDVTDLEQAKIEMRKAKEAADQANQAKSGFLANMSHEIRTPMNAILGFTEVLRRGLEESETHRLEHLDTIHRSGKHLLNLINDILDLSKIESGRLELELTGCSPHQILNDVVSVLKGRADEKGIGLKFRSEGGLPATITSDPTRLRQLVTNLVGNAIKFTESGTVEIVARVVQDNKKPQLQIDVIDSGIGMTDEQMERIFKPFTQADASVTRRYGGTGLGLSISKRIAEALGGSLTVTSKEAVGSRFTAIVETGPLYDVEMVSDEDARKVTTQRGPDGHVDMDLPPSKILVVDDGDANRKLMALVLKRAGVEVSTAENGRVACEMAANDDFDVILMDMQMPVMDGYAATRELRRTGFGRPIIALTADAMKGSEERCRAAGCSGFLTKPIDMDLLISSLGQELEKLGRKRKPRAPANTSPGSASARDAEPRAAKERKPKPPQATPNEGDWDLVDELILSVDREDATDAGAGSTSPSQESRIFKSSEGPIVSQFFDDDPEARDIIIDYVSHLSNQLNELQLAWAQEKFDEVERLAHAIKGSAGTLGFDQFTEPAQTLMFLAKTKQMGQIDAAIDELIAMSDRIVVPGGQASF